MRKDIFKIIFERDLNSLKEELMLFEDEKNIWKANEGISNVSGNLCLHLIGNLNHFIGAVLGNTGFIRNREEEFALKNVSRVQILIDIDKTIQVIKMALDTLSDEDFEKEYPLEKHGEKVSTEYMLMHLITHFNYHLGQINYHRRILTNKFEKIEHKIE